MKTYLFSTFLAVITLFTLPVTAAEAHLFELNLADVLPENAPFESIAVESALIDVQVALLDGSSYHWTEAEALPAVSEVAALSVEGPEVRLILKTKSGKEIVTELDSISLLMTQVFEEGRQNLDLSLSMAGAGKEKLEVSEESEIFSLITTNLLRAVLFGGQDQITLQLHCSMDEGTRANPSLSLRLEMGEEVVEFNAAYTETSSIGSWKVEGALGGETCMINSLVDAMRLIGQGAKLLEVENETQELLKYILCHLEMVADFTAPFTTWEGIGMIAGGSFMTDTNEADIHQIQLESSCEFLARNGNWDVKIGNLVEVVHGEQIPTTGSFVISITDPSENLVRVCDWIRLNALEEFSTFLNTPAISTYGGYLGDKLTPILVSVFDTIGQTQTDGSLAFSIRYDETGKTWINGICVDEVGSLVYQKAKEKIRWW